jgi:hypothetical protein
MQNEQFPKQQYLQSASLITMNSKNMYIAQLFVLHFYYILWDTCHIMYTNILLLNWYGILVDVFIQHITKGIPD